MKKEYLFGRDHFQKWSKCERTYRLTVFPKPLRDLLDHGFIADAACVWGNPELENHELAVISRTYCSEEDVKNPPNGLMCHILPKEVMGKDDRGIPIATVIVGMSDYSNTLLNACKSIPADIFGWFLSQDMIRDGYVISLQGTPTGSKAKIIRGESSIRRSQDR